MKLRFSDLIFRTSTADHDYRNHNNDNTGNQIKATFLEVILLFTSFSKTFNETIVFTSLSTSLYLCWMMWQNITCIKLRNIRAINIPLLKRDVTYGERKVTISYKLFETNSSFHLKLHTTEKVWFLFFKIFLLGLIKFSFLQEDCTQGYHSMGFSSFPDISLFPKILCVKSFGNSWGNSYIPCL